MLLTVIAMGLTFIRATFTGQSRLLRKAVVLPAQARVWQLQLL